FIPLLANRLEGAHSSFEIFSPEINGELGDPARGGFVGGGGEPLVPGILNAERFLHSAEGVPDASSRGFIVGGVCSAGAGQSWEIYDGRRPGGDGVYDNAGALMRNVRPLPGAIALGNAARGRIWIFGGAVTPLSNADLAEVWTPSGTNLLGETAAAT